MPEISPQNVTELLIGWSSGNEQALVELMPLVYNELRHLARSYMRRERPDHTLATTDLIHEAYLRMAEQKIPWKSRSHFFGIAAQMMRRVLIDYAKSHRRAKRGGGAFKIPENGLIAETAGVAAKSIEPAKLPRKVLRSMGCIRMASLPQLCP